jgi:hypothetical protein
MLRAVTYGNEQTPPRYPNRFGVEQCSKKKAQHAIHGLVVGRFVQRIGTSCKKTT